MSKLKIVKFPDELLKVKSKDLKNIDGNIKTLTDNMTDTMFAAKGIGLASVQIGELLRMCVIDFNPDDKDKPDPRAVINPVILSKEDPIQFEEGCLSIPGYSEKVDRFNKIHVMYYDLAEKEYVVDVEGILAVAFQHEIDHMDGRLFIDRLSSLKKNLLKKKILKDIKENGDL